MNAIDTEKVRAELVRVAPRRVRAYRGDEHLRDVAVPPGRKRWQAVLTILESLPWTRLELVDKAGDLLACVETHDEPAAPPPPALAMTGDERIVALVLRGQHEVLAMRGKEVDAALGAMTTLVGQLTTAVGALAHTYQLAIQQMQDMPPRIVHMQSPPEEREGLESSKLLDAMLPMLMQRMLASGMMSPPPAAPATPPNGAKQ